jgi:DNA-binding MarR family transcriptional regulator
MKRRLTSKVTPELARVHNTHLVFKTIYQGRQTSRADIARVTRLNRPAVSDLIADLITQGLVEEVGYRSSTGESALCSWTL